MPQEFEQMPSSMISFSVIKNQITTGKLKFKCVNEKYLKFVDKFGEDKIKEICKAITNDLIGEHQYQVENQIKKLRKTDIERIEGVCIMIN